MSAGLAAFPLRRSGRPANRKRLFAFRLAAFWGPILAHLYFLFSAECAVPSLDSQRQQDFSEAGKVSRQKVRTRARARQPSCKFHAGNLSLLVANADEQVGKGMKEGIGRRRLTRLGRVSALCAVTRHPPQAGEQGLDFARCAL